MTRDDHALLAAHVAGDPAAFGELFGRHADRLWSLALRTLQRPEDAEEVLQEAMLAAFRHAAGFRGEAAVGTWLYRIVLNACLDRLRRVKARPTAFDGEEVVAALPSPAAEPEAVVLQRELADEVEDALGQLSADQRTAIVLVHLDGYSIEEAAVLLGCAPGTVKSRCARGRAKLAPLLRHLVEA